MWHHDIAKAERCCCRLIVQAVRAGGPGSDNSRLRDLLAQARTVNIPKDIIERNIRTGSAPNQADYVEVTSVAARFSQTTRSSARWCPVTDDELMCSGACRSNTKVTGLVALASLSSVRPADAPCICYS